MNEIIVKYIEPDKWWQRARWELVQDWISSNGVKVPKGYITDGASIPIAFRSFFSPTGPIFPAAIVHDYILDSCDDCKDRIGYANQMFLEELNLIRISRFRRWMVYTAVRLGKHIGTMKEFE